MKYYTAMNNLAQNSVEQKLIIGIFELIKKLGYGGQPKYSKLVTTESGIFRIIVDGSAVSYNITYDPINKRGLLFDEYLENVVIHMIGVKDQYRELSIKMLFMNPKTMIRAYKWYILKTSKENHQSKIGLAWLNKESSISTDQALNIIDIMLISTDKI